MTVNYLPPVITVICRMFGVLSGWGYFTCCYLQLSRFDLFKTGLSFFLPRPLSLSDSDPVQNINQLRRFGSVEKLTLRKGGTWLDGLNCSGGEGGSVRGRLRGPFRFPCPTPFSSPKPQGIRPNLQSRWWRHTAETVFRERTVVIRVNVLPPPVLTNHSWLRIDLLYFVSNLDNRCPLWLQPHEEGWVV